MSYKKKGGVSTLTCEACSETITAPGDFYDVRRKAEKAGWYLGASGSQNSLHCCPKHTGR